MTQKKEKDRKLNKLSLWIGIIGGTLGIISFTPQIKEFFGWAENLKYLELKASFPNEKWLEAEEEDYIWIVGEWHVPSLRGFIAEFKIEDGKLFRRNKGEDILNPGQHFVTDWFIVTVHKSNEGLLRMSFPASSDWAISFIKKNDNCMCYETERYIDNYGNVSSGDGRQMFNSTHTQFTNGGMTYECK